MASWTITIQEAANLLGVHESTIRRYAKANKVAECTVGGIRHVLLDDVVTVMEERRRQEKMLSSRQVSELLGVGQNHLGKQIRSGKLKASGRDGHGGYLMEPEAVADYWRREMNSVCVRCGILGEARAELGFVCPMCDYEKRTGKIYSWPICRRESVGLRRGRVAA